MHHFPPYSRAGGRIHQKTMIFGHLRRKLLLNESRKVCPCHTFQTDAAEIFTPTCSLSATHAKRCNSCRSGAWPTMPKPHPCRARRRQKPNQALAIITIGTEGGLVPLEKHHTSHPHAGATAKPEGKRRNRAKRPRGKTLRIPRENEPTARSFLKAGRSRRSPPKAAQRRDRNKLRVVPGRAGAGP